MQVPIYKSDLLIVLEEAIQTLKGLDLFACHQMIRAVNSDAFPEVCSSENHFFWKKIYPQAVINASDRSKLIEQYREELRKTKEAQIKLDLEISSLQNQLRLAKRNLTGIERESVEIGRKLRYTNDLGNLVINGVLFQCPLCQYKSTDQSDLDEHMKSKTTAACLVDGCGFETHDHQAYFEHATQHSEHKRLAPDDHPSKRQCL